MAPAENEFTPEMIAIRAGLFLMGGEDGPDNEKPAHRVRVGAFWLGKFPVTNREYKTFVVKSGAAAPPFWSEAPFSHSDKPVVGVSWHDAVAYCEWLSQPGGKQFRLPTEAEWERAARGGREGERYPWGNDLPDDCPGYDVESNGPERVGAGVPNAFGLYDMCASVHEWCNDFYDPNYYKISPEKNPVGPPAGMRRVSRGGSWRHHVKFSRCAARSSLNPTFKYADYGFRVAMNVGE
jgi:formylglycine-generating enzyme required for sulfatase activity